MSNHIDLLFKKLISSIQDSLDNKLDNQVRVVNRGSSNFGIIRFTYDATILDKYYLINTNALEIEFQKKENEIILYTNKIWTEFQRSDNATLDILDDDFKYSDIYRDLAKEDKEYLKSNCTRVNDNEYRFTSKDIYEVSSFSYQKETFWLNTIYTFQVDTNKIITILDDFFKGLEEVHIKSTQDTEQFIKLLSSAINNLQSYLSDLGYSSYKKNQENYYNALVRDILK